jgi:hypothetical protein
MSGGFPLVHLIIRRGLLNLQIIKITFRIILFIIVQIITISLKPIVWLI